MQQHSSDGDAESKVDDEAAWAQHLERQLSSGSCSADAVHDPFTGYRLLHEAARRNDSAALAALLRHRADADAPDCRGGCTALHVCVACGSRDCLALLLSHAADANRANTAGETPLHLAASMPGGDAAASLQALLDAGADCGLEDVYGDNALHRACLQDNGKAAKVLLAAAPELVNRPTGGPHRSTGLHIAASSENSQLLALLLRRGADFLAPDCHGRSAVDLLLDRQDTSSIDCIGRHLLDEVRQFRHGEPVQELLARPEAQRYLDQLLRIDGVCDPVPTLPPPPAAADTRLADLRRAIACRKIDAARLVAELEATYQADLTGALEAGPPELMQRLVELTLRLVLLPQETPLLRRLLACRRLWRCLAWRLQADVSGLYDRALRGSKSGIRQVLKASCTAATGEPGAARSIDLAKLNGFLAEVTTYWQFRRRPLMLSEDANAAMRDPLQSLALWATLTGRLKIVPDLLGQEEFDLVPLALLTATLLRALATRRDVEDVFVDRADKVADLCEGMAIQVVKEVKEVDNSYGNNLTIAYVSLPLPNYANYTVLDLAARGSASSFIKLDIVELATDKSWYGDFFDFRRSLAREALILAGFVPPLMLLLPSLVQRMRNPESRCFLETVTRVSVAQCRGEEEERLAEEVDEEARATRLGLLGDSFEHRLDLPHSPAAGRSPDDGMSCSKFVTELLDFYGTPCVKFRVNAVFYFSFVTMLSLMILSDFEGPSSPIELICYFTILGVFVEELREMITYKRQETLGVYLSDGWNIIDLVAIACGFLAFVARRIGSGTFDVLAMLSEGGHERRTRDLSYIFIVITTLIFWIRILFISIVLESVGVKLKMLSLMIKKDFIPFLYILVVIMLGFGIAFHALLWPNGQFYAKGRAEPVDISPPDIMLQMFKRTFYTIVGEYGLDEMENECTVHAAVARGTFNASSLLVNASSSSSGSSSSSDDADNTDPSDKCVSFPGSVLVPYILMVVYIVIVQVLLLNVIVAMFSKTIDMVDSESKAMWLYERYDLNCEFVKRSTLPAPFNIALELKNLVAWGLGLLAGACRSSEKAERQRLSESEVTEQNTSNFVYLFYLFYQAVTLRRLRKKLDGIPTDDSELSNEGVLLMRRLGELRRTQADLKDYLDSQGAQLSGLAEKLDRLLAIGRDCHHGDNAESE